MSNTNRGFTLIELLVVIGVIGVLSGILYVVIDPQAQRNKAKDAVLKEHLVKISMAVRAYQAVNFSIPSRDSLVAELGSAAHACATGGYFQIDGIVTSRLSNCSGGNSIYLYSTGCVGTSGFSTGPNGRIKNYAVFNAKIKSTDSGSSFYNICSDWDNTNWVDEN